MKVFTCPQYSPAAKCAKCSELGFRFRGGRWLCLIHNRIDTMQNSARSKGKYVPSEAELLKLAARLVRRNMKCDVCEATMHWHTTGSRNYTVSLQHDRSGKVRLICMGCNQRHDDLPGDSLYELPKDHWRCARCEKVKPLPAFYKDRAGSCCKSCRKTLNAEMWKRFGKKWAANSKRRKKRARV